MDYTYIIIPTFGQLDYLTKCISSLEDKTSSENVRILISYENWDLGKPRGFPTTVNNLINFALLDSNCTEIVILNSDIEVITERWLDKIREYVKDKPDIGMVAPLELNKFPDGEYSRLPSSGEKRLPGEGDPTDLVYPQFSFVWIKREVIEKVGLLDENYGLGYYEDEDYGIRTWIAGYRTVMLPDIIYRHKRGATFDGIIKKGLFTSTEPQTKLFEKKFEGIFKLGEDVNLVLERFRKYIKCPRS